jgi:hypothetical protein
MISVRVLVEGKLDAFWIELLVVKALSSTEVRVSAIACGGKEAVFQRLRAELGSKDRVLHDLPDTAITVAVVDADTNNLADARVATPFRDAPNIASHVFFAVPTMESWLFADLQAAKRHAVKNSGLSLDLIQFPDEFPMAKELAARVFGGATAVRSKGRQVIEDMDMSIAVSRSPSLRDFILGLSSIIGLNVAPELVDADRLLGRRLLGSLINETNPSSRVLYKTMSGQRVTASELAAEIAKGTPIGRQYAADLLRIARELLAQEAQDESKKP